jgi:mono/diheme cytochrome c family protein
VRSRAHRLLAAGFLTGIITLTLCAAAQESHFRNAPESAAQLKNPYQGNASAAAAGKKLYGQNCSQCHGNNLQGIGPAPALDNPSTQKAAPGELFWFITNGNLNAGMPSWAALPKQQRWQIVTFLETRVSKSETK